MRLVPIVAIACLFLATLGPAQASAQSSGCVFLTGGGPAAFCDTFSAPGSGTPRATALNPVWGVSRALGGGYNQGQNAYGSWNLGPLAMCDGSQPNVLPPNDIAICNGQLREEVNDTRGLSPNDDGDASSLALYPKQPFDFGGRTGTISFDVSNDRPQIHSYWPEVWITDKPVPDPFTHFGSWIAQPQNGVGIRLAGGNVGDGRSLNGTVCPNDGNYRWSLESAVTINNWVVNDQDNGGSVSAQMTDCVTATPLPGAGTAQVNHVEIKVSQNQIDVYASDSSRPGQYGPMHHIGSVPNLNLSFTSGLVWLEDAHYNAHKAGNGAVNQHTFAWGNFAFDGPVKPQDLAFDAPDNLATQDFEGQVNLGYPSTPSSPASVTVPNVYGMQNAKGAIVTVSVNPASSSPSVINYSLNGHTYSEAWPYSPNGSTTWRTMFMPVNLSDVTAGSNVITVATDQAMAVANVDLILVGAGGSSGSGSGSGGSATSTPVSTNTPMATATNTAIATATKTLTVAPTATATPSAPTPTATAQSASGPWKLNAALSLKTISPGQAETLTITVNPQSAATALADVEIYNPQGQKQFQQYWDDQSFLGGQTRVYRAVWQIPNGTPNATYTVTLGVFAPGWGPLLDWNWNAAQFDVSS